MLWDCSSKSTMPFCHDSTCLFPTMLFFLLFGGKDCTDTLIIQTGFTAIQNVYTSQTVKHVLLPVSCVGLLDV